MVVFGSTDYFHALDAPKKQIKDMGLRDFGVSTRMGDVLQSLKAELASGATHVELGFTGKGKGSLGGGNTTPEMFDKVKREEIRQLAKINGVSLSTHGSVGISGASGQTQQGFSEQARKETLIELRRTIDFAADTAGGGAVVFHTNEFPREIKDTRFKVGGKEKEAIYLANKESGKIMAIPATPLDVPKWKMVNGEYVDLDGDVLSDPRDYAKRVPLIDKEGNIEWQKKTFDEFKKDIGDWNSKHKDTRSPEKEFAFLQQFQQIQAEQPRTLEYLKNAQKYTELYEDMKKKAVFWEELEKKTSEDKKEYLYQAFRDEFKELAPEVDKKGKTPSQVLKEHSQRVKNEVIHFREGYIGFEKNVKQLNRDYENIDEIEKVGVDKSATTFAEAAMYAYRVEKQKKLERPIFVAPENMFAEWGYGGHPDELRNLIVSSRAKMVDALKMEGIKEKEATKIAEDHIKATFDIGHANTWAKYFEEDSKLSPEKNKEKFNKWLLGEVEKLAKDKIIGHVHMSDNFGYFDEHLNAGTGNAPLKEFIETLKSKKYEGDIVVEWGAQGAEEPSGAMLAAWANLAGSPIYRIEGVGPSWSQIDSSGYFGSSSSPFMVVGKYGGAMGKDWNLWGYSEAPIE